MSECHFHLELRN